MTGARCGVEWPTTFAAGRADALRPRSWPRRWPPDTISTPRHTASGGHASSRPATAHHLAAARARQGAVLLFLAHRTGRQRPQALQLHRFPLAEHGGALPRLEGCHMSFPHAAAGSCRNWWRCAASSFHGLSRAPFDRPSFRAATNQPPQDVAGSAVATRHVPVEHAAAIGYAGTLAAVDAPVEPQIGINSASCHAPPARPARPSFCHRHVRSTLERNAAAAARG